MTIYMLRYYSENIPKTTEKEAKLMAKMAEACPHISIGGSMLVSEMMEM